MVLVLLLQQQCQQDSSCHPDGSTHHCRVDAGQTNLRNSSKWARWGQCLVLLTRLGWHETFGWYLSQSQPAQATTCCWLSLVWMCQLLIHHTTRIPETTRLCRSDAPPPLQQPNLPASPLPTLCP
jgi:hypothetical protein